jgi:hypothetical protein
MQLLAATGDLANLKAWLGNLVGIGCIIAGAVTVLRAHSQNHSGAFRGVMIVLVGLFLVALGNGNNATSVGNWLVNLFVQ